MGDLGVYRGKQRTLECTRRGMEGMCLCKEDNRGVPREHNEGNGEDMKAAG